MSFMANFLIPQNNVYFFAVWCGINLNTHIQENTGIHLHIEGGKKHAFSNYCSVKTEWRMQKDIGEA